MTSIQRKGSHELKGIRIARVSTVPYFVVTQLRHQLEYLADHAAAHVYLVTSPGKELHQLKARKNLHKVTIRISRHVSPLRDSYSLLQLMLFFRKTKINIVHSTTPKAGLLCAIAAKWAGVPVRLHTFTGQPWVTLTGGLRSIAISADRIIARLNTKCYADSQSQADFLVQREIISPEKIGVLGRGSLAGVDLARFSPKKWDKDKQMALRKRLGISTGDFVVLFVGRISRDKGIYDLLEAIQNLTGTQPGIRLILIGPMDEETGGRATVTLKQAGRHPAIHYLGYRKCPEKYMAMADILCLPSYREGFGTVIIEAAAMETGAIASRIYGLTDAVVDKETGIFIQPGDIRQLTEVILHLARNPDKCRFLGRNARRHVEKWYDAHKMNILLVDAYAKCITRTESLDVKNK